MKRRPACKEYARIASTVGDVRGRTPLGLSRPWSSRSDGKMHPRK